jgi:hypothetical protein
MAVKNCKLPTCLSKYGAGISFDDHFVFSTIDPNHPQIWHIQQIHLETGELETLVTIRYNPQTRGHYLAWFSPDGKSLIYEVYLVETIQLFRLNLVTHQTEALTDNTESYAFAGWGPTIGRDWSARRMGIIGAAFGLLACLPYRKMWLLRRREVLGVQEAKI